MRITDGAVLSIKKMYDKNRSINLSYLNLNLDENLSVTDKVEKKLELIIIFLRKNVGLTRYSSILIRHD